MLRRILALATVAGAAFAADAFDHQRKAKVACRAREAAGILDVADRGRQHTMSRRELARPPLVEQQFKVITRDPRKHPRRPRTVFEAGAERRVAHRKDVAIRTGCSDGGHRIQVLPVTRRWGRDHSQ